MRLGLNLGLMGGSLGGGFPRAFVVAGSPRSLLGYDSNSQYERGQASITGGYRDEMEAVFGAESGTQPFFIAGCYLLKSTRVAASGVYSLIDDTASDDPADWVRDTQYDTNISNLTADVNTNDIFHIIGGTNNANSAGGITKARYKQGMVKLWEFIQADFVNIQAIVKSPIHRTTSAADDSLWELVRTADTELADEYNWFFLGSERYLDDLRDAVHYTDATLTGRTAEARARDAGYAFKADLSAGAFGPLPTAAEFKYDRLRYTITHDAGTDLTVTSGCEDTFAITVDGTKYQPSSVVKVDSTTIDLFFEDEAFDPSLLTEAISVYGAMSDLSQTSPETVSDNATLIQPLRRSVIVPTIADPLAGMNPNTFIIPSLVTKTFSGSDVTAITDLAGMDWNIAAANYPQYDSVNRRLTSPDTVTAMRSDAIDFSGGEMLMFFVFYLPSSYSNFQPFSIGTTTTGSTNCALQARTSEDELWWLRDEAGTFPVLATSTKGEKFVICVHQSDASTMDIYCNSTTPVSFDPNNAISSQTIIWLFGLKSGNPSANGMYIDYFWARNTKIGVGDTSIADCITALASNYGVTLT